MGPAGVAPAIRLARQFTDRRHGLVRPEERRQIVRQVRHGGAPNDPVASGAPGQSLSGGKQDCSAQTDDEAALDRWNHQPFMPGTDFNGQAPAR